MSRRKEVDFLHGSVVGPVHGGQLVLHGVPDGDGRLQAGCIEGLLVLEGHWLIQLLLLDHRIEYRLAHCHVVQLGWLEARELSSVCLIPPRGFALVEDGGRVLLAHNGTHWVVQLGHRDEGLLAGVMEGVLVRESDVRQLQGRVGVVFDWIPRLEVKEALA